MAYYTIKQLADAFNVSVQAIHQEIKKAKYEPYISKRKIGARNTIVLNEEALNYLNQHFKPLKKVDNQDIKPIKDKIIQSKDNNNTSLNSSNQDFKDLNNDLINNLNKLNQDLKDNKAQFQEIIDSKNKTIELLTKELEQVHTELQHEQELHLMDQKQVKELENKVKQLENQPVDNKVNNVNNSVEEIKKEPPKKWWQFWK